MGRGGGWNLVKNDGREALTFSLRLPTCVNYDRSTHAHVHVLPQRPVTVHDYELDQCYNLLLSVVFVFRL